MLTRAFSVALLLATSAIFATAKDALDATDKPDRTDSPHGDSDSTSTIAQSGSTVTAASITPTANAAGVTATVVFLPATTDAVASPSWNGCATGSLQCCKYVDFARSREASEHLHELGIALSDHNLNVNIGVSCTSLSVVGLHSGSCTFQPVCCINNGFGGVVAIECSPVRSSS